MRSFLFSFFVLLLSTSYAFAGAYEFMDDIAGGLNKKNQAGMIQALDAALENKERFNSIPDDHEHDTNIRNKLFKRSISIISTEPAGSEFALQVADGLIQLAKDDQKVQHYFNDYLIIGHDEVIIQKIKKHKEQH